MSSSPSVSDAITSSSSSQMFTGSSAPNPKPAPVSPRVPSPSPSPDIELLQGRVSRNSISPPLVSSPSPMVTDSAAPTPIPLTAVNLPRLSPSPTSPSDIDRQTSHDPFSPEAKSENEDVVSTGSSIESEDEQTRTRIFNALEHEIEWSIQDRVSERSLNDISKILHESGNYDKWLKTALNLAVKSKLLWRALHSWTQHSNRDIRFFDDCRWTGAMAFRDFSLLDELLSRTSDAAQLKSVFLWAVLKDHSDLSKKAYEALGDQRTAVLKEAMDEAFNSLESVSLGRLLNVIPGQELRNWDQYRLKYYAMTGNTTKVSEILARQNFPKDLLSRVFTSAVDNDNFACAINIFNKIDQKLREGIVLHEFFKAEQSQSLQKMNLLLQFTQKEDFRFQKFWLLAAAGNDKRQILSEYYAQDIDFSKNVLELALIWALDNESQSCVRFLVHALEDRFGISLTDLLEKQAQSPKTVLRLQRLLECADLNALPIQKYRLLAAAGTNDQATLQDLLQSGHDFSREELQTAFSGAVEKEFTDCIRLLSKSPKLEEEDILMGIHIAEELNNPEVSQILKDRLTYLRSLVTIYFV